MRGLCPDRKLPPLPTDDVDAERRRQEIAHMRDYFAQLDRLHSVAFRLRAANRDYCKNGTSAQIGLLQARSEPAAQVSFLRP